MKTWLTSLTLGAIGLAAAGCGATGDNDEGTGAPEPTVQRVVGEFTMEMSAPSESGDGPGLAPETVAQVHGSLATVSRNTSTCQQGGGQSWRYNVELSSVTEDAQWGCLEPYWVQLDSIAGTTACDASNGSTTAPLWNYADVGSIAAWEFRPPGGGGSFTVHGYVYADCTTYP